MTSLPATVGDVDSLEEAEDATAKTGVVIWVGLRAAFCVCGG